MDPAVGSASGAPPATGQAIALLPGLGGTLQLQPGATVDAQVLAALTAGRFLISIGGREVVAESTADLRPGSQISLNVAAAGADGVQLRLVEPVRADTSSPAQRLANAGLPATPAAAAVLAAFEEAGAPLEPKRLQAALAAATAPEAPPRAAAAYALLAQARLPATPALVALAVRAAAGGTPNLGEAVVRLQQAAAQVVAAETNAPPAATAPPAGGTARTAVTTAPLAPSGQPAPAPTSPAPQPRAWAPAAPAPEPVPVPSPSPTPEAAIPRSGAWDDAPRSTIRPGPAVTVATTVARAPDGTLPPRGAEAVAPPRIAAAITILPAADDDQPGMAAPRAQPVPTPTATSTPPPQGSQPAAVRTPSVGAAPLAAASPATAPGPAAAAPQAAQPAGTPSAAIPQPTTTPVPNTGAPPAPVIRTGAPAVIATTTSAQTPIPTSTPAGPVVATAAGTTAPAQTPVEAPSRPVAPGAAVPTTGTAPATTPVAAPRPAILPTVLAASTNPGRPASAPASASALPADVMPADTLPPSGSASADPDTALPEPAITRSIALRALAGLVVPDAERDGAPAVMRALQLAGVRPSSADAAPAAPPLAQHLGASALAQEPRAAPTPTSPPPPTAAAAQLDTASAHTAREQLAEQVFKPKELADYDRVVPLPLAAQQVPTPARLAVASRDTGGGQRATFLRVDAEMTRLGPVSVRLGGVDGGPLTITLFARPGAAGLLVDELPAIGEDLRKAGIDAGIRVVEESPGG